MFNKCPGATIENCKLAGFRKYGIRVDNVEGLADRPVDFAFEDSILAKIGA